MHRRFSPDYILRNDVLNLICHSRFICVANRDKAEKCVCVCVGECQRESIRQIERMCIFRSLSKRTAHR